MREDNFIYLLAALFIFLVVLPMGADLDLISRSLLKPISIVCLLAIGVWSLRDSRWTFRIGLGLVAVGIVAESFEAATGQAIYGNLSLLTVFLFLALGTLNAIKLVLLGNELSANRLYGALCVYLMIGVIWAIMYIALYSADPSSFDGSIINDDGNWDLTWFYYSFVTLTTLGYGDILPVSETARVLAYTEAVIGVFYMAVLVAALVGAYTASRNKSA